MLNVINADITKLWLQGKTVCVTTNGFTRKDGSGVMGCGNALAMAKIIPELPICLGRHILDNGNVVGFIYDRVIAFPVKPIVGKSEQALDRVKHLYQNKKTVPGFHCKADMDIIKQSAYQLVHLIEKEKLQQVYLPLPGVGNGGLTFEQVSPVLEYLNKNKVILLTL